DVSRRPFLLQGQLQLRNLCYSLVRCFQVSSTCVGMSHRCSIRFQSEGFEGPSMCRKSSLSKSSASASVRSGIELSSMKRN
ncbi:hypothetical protein AVEN_55176-1, partial [Araneus ventricosus]